MYHTRNLGSLMLRSLCPRGFHLDIKTGDDSQNCKLKILIVCQIRRMGFGTDVKMVNAAINLHETPYPSVVTRCLGSESPPRRSQVYNCSLIGLKQIWEVTKWNWKSVLLTALTKFGSGPRLQA